MADRTTRRSSLTTTPFPSFPAASSSIAPVVPLHHLHPPQHDLEAGHVLQDYPSPNTRIPRINTTDLSSEHPWLDEETYDSHDEDAESSERDRLTGFPSSSHMTRSKGKARSPDPRGTGAAAASGHQQPNGSTATSPTDGMNGSFRERAKHGAADDSASQTARLMERSSFTLDEAPPALHDHEKDGDSGKSFFELPQQDRRNFLLLVLLYFLQGIPMGLAGGSVPFLLKQHLSYGQIGVYSLASYPYSLKLLWSPIVDAVWSSRVGRRKSWILPIQVCSGLGMIWLGTHAQAMMEKAGENDGAGVWGFTGWWFALVFMCATQDIAVDGEFFVWCSMVWGFGC